MNKLLTDYKNFLATDSDLKAQFGSPLIQAKVTETERETFTASDVITAIKKYRAREITLQNLVDWVNTLWFVDGLYNCEESQGDSIASVMDLLEELDEDGVAYTDDEYDCMIAALESNTEYKTSRP
jgi:hypothetical protein